MLCRENRGELRKRRVEDRVSLWGRVSLNSSFASLPNSLIVVILCYIYRPVINTIDTCGVSSTRHWFRKAWASSIQIYRPVKREIDSTTMRKKNLAKSSFTREKKKYAYFAMYLLWNSIELEIIISSCKFFQADAHSIDRRFYKILRKCITLSEDEEWRIFLDISEWRYRIKNLTDH